MRTRSASIRTWHFAPPALLADVDGATMDAANTPEACRLQIARAGDPT
jgi:hypothetical protein